MSPELGRLARLTACRPVLILAVLAVAIALGFAIVGWREARVWLRQSKDERYLVAVRQRSDFRAGEAFYRRGAAFLSKGQLKEAGVEFRAAQAVDRRSSAARSGLGMVLEQEGRGEDAVKEYLEAIRLEPGNADARNNLGLLLQRRGELAAAAEQFRKIVETKPGYVRARNNLGNLLLQQGQVEEAAQQFREAVRIDPAYATLPDHARHATGKTAWAPCSPAMLRCSERA